MLRRGYFFGCHPIQYFSVWLRKLPDGFFICGRYVTPTSVGKMLFVRSGRYTDCSWRIVESASNDEADADSDRLFRATGVSDRSGKETGLTRSSGYVHLYRCRAYWETTRKAANSRLQGCAAHPVHNLIEGTARVWDHIQARRASE